MENNTRRGEDEWRARASFGNFNASLVTSTPDARRACLFSPRTSKGDRGRKWNSPSSKDFSFEAAEGIDSLDLAIWNLVSRRGTRRPPRYRASSSFSGSSGSGPLASLASRANSLSCNWVFSSAIRRPRYIYRGWEGARDKEGRWINGRRDGKGRTARHGMARHGTARHVAN